LTQRNGEVILVVDDETAIYDITKTALGKYNYQVMTAHNGIEAIALYVEFQNEIPLVLTDIVMPSMDGLTTIRTLNKINPNVEIIAISGLPSSDKVNAVYNLGVATFLSKPYTTNQLLKSIDTVIS
jgi:CheY-like chemotaxis protein